MKNNSVHAFLKKHATRYPRASQFLCFCIVGGTGLLVNLLITYILTQFGHLWYFWSYLIGTLVSWTFSFCLNARFTFSSMPKTISSWLGRYMVFIGGYMIFFWLSAGLVYILTSVFTVPYLISIIFSAVFTTFGTFTLGRKVIFAPIHIFMRPSDTFFDESIRRVITDKTSLLDVGGGLRIDKARSNRLDPKHAWIREAIEKQKRIYRVLDYVDTYHPDVVGDIQNLPLPDNSEEAIICLSILEHVPDPFASFREMYRVLKPGGYCFIYVPFLFYYHAEEGYYGDYWRFTEDSLRLLSKDFSSIEIQSTRGPLEMLVRLSPLGRIAFFCDLAFLVDKVTRKLSSKQTSGYNLFLVK